MRSWRCCVDKALVLTSEPAERKPHGHARPGRGGGPPPRKRSSWRSPREPPALRAESTLAGAVPAPAHAVAAGLAVRALVGGGVSVAEPRRAWTRARRAAPGAGVRAVVRPAADLPGRAVAAVVARDRETTVARGVAARLAGVAPGCAGAPAAADLRPRRAGLSPRAACDGAAARPRVGAGVRRGLSARAPVGAARVDRLPSAASASASASARRRVWIGRAVVPRRAGQGLLRVARAEEVGIGRRSAAGDGEDGDCRTEEHDRRSHQSQTMNGRAAFVDRSPRHALVSTGSAWGEPLLPRDRLDPACRSRHTLGSRPGSARGRALVVCARLGRAASAGPAGGALIEASPLLSPC